jgi:hypothetical protein
MFAVMPNARVLYITDSDIFPIPTDGLLVVTAPITTLFTTRICGRRSRQSTRGAWREEREYPIHRTDSKAAAPPPTTPP